MVKTKKNTTTKLYISTICALAINLSASDLGTIQVESSTIDDKLDSKKTEVSSVSKITAKDVEEINPKTITDLLNTVPGVTVSNVGTDRAKIHIRGVDNQMYMGEKPGVAIVIDGVPVQETSGKINVDLDNIESIKVIKGGAAYLYGNDALSGAIVITTKRAKGVSSSKIESEIGSYNSKRVMATTNQAFDNSALQLQGNYRSSDGYWEDAFFLIRSINGKYDFYIDDTSDITFGLDYTQRRTGDGNSVSGTTEAKTNPKSEGYYSYSGYYNTNLTKGFVTYSKDFGKDSNLMLMVHKYQDDKSYKTGRFKYDKDEIWNQNGAKSEYRTVFGDLAIMAGLDVQRNDTKQERHKISDGSLDQDYKTDEAVNAFYTEIGYQATKDLTATLNFRYDNIDQKYKDNTDSANDVDQTFDVLSYRAGLTYSLSENTSFYTSFSTGFRTPTVEQTSQNKVSLAADPTLDIPSKIGVETTYNYEIGIRGKVSEITYDASVYQLDRRNYIGRIAGSYITSDDDNESNYDNVGDMRSRGFELSLQSNKSRMFSFDLAYTYLDAVFTNYTISQQLTADPDGWGPLTATYARKDLSGNQVSRTPKHTLDFTLHYKPVKDAIISTELLVKSSYYADEVNAHKQAGYEVVNLRGEYKFNDNFEIFARIDNVLNKEYYQFVNISSSAIATMENDATVRVAPPTTYYAGLRLKF